MAKKINVKSNDNIYVEWCVSSIDYSKEGEENIRQLTARKYEVDPSQVVVVPKYDSKEIKESTSNIAKEAIESIHEPSYHLKLYKKYLDRNGYPEDSYDFVMLTEIDGMVNSAIDYNAYLRNRRYDLKWIRWSNFLSYGPDNYFDFTTLSGLVAVSGEPANQCGKSTFTNDLIHYGLYGRTCSGKADVMADYFNRCLPEETQMFVKTCICIDGEDYVIERIVNRPELSKRKGKNTAKGGGVKYYKLINGQENELVDVENLEEQSTLATNKVIKEALGIESDFDLVVSANADNLKSLINLGETARGDLMQKWTGLSVLKSKFTTAKEIFQAKQKNYLQGLSIEGLKKDIENYNNSNTELYKFIKAKKEEYKESENKIKKMEEDKDNLLVQKQPIDPVIANLDMQTLETQLEKHKQDGIKVSQIITSDTEKLAELSKYTFDEAAYKALLTRKQNGINLVTQLQTEIRIAEDNIKRAKAQGVCPTCGQKLQNCDHAHIEAVIAENSEKITKNSANITKYNNAIAQIDSDIAVMEENKRFVDSATRLSIKVEADKARLENLRHAYSDIKDKIDRLNKNKEIIVANNAIDTQVNVIKANIAAENAIKNNIYQEATMAQKDTESNVEKIKEREGYIARIEVEEKEKANWKLYLELIGKDGIGKMVLRDILPSINFELHRLLSETCDFDVVVEITDSNDIEFYIVKKDYRAKLSSGSGYEQTAAALALRIVLGNLNTCSKPTFIVLDEILGGIAKENYPKIKKLYDKMVKNFAFVLHICHIEDIDWATSRILIKKENGISTVYPVETIK